VDETTKVIIIGSGLAGLSIASELSEKYNLDSIILEKEAVAASTWFNMPDFLNLVSPWYCNRPFLLKKIISPFYKMPAKEYGKLLQDYAEKTSFDIRYSQKVSTVTCINNNFTIETLNKTYKSKVVIQATGYYSFPFTPNYPGLQNTKIKTVHFKDYKNPETSLKEAQNILIIGKRISAGQLLLELSDRFNVSLSTRSEIIYGPGEFIWSIIFPIYPLLERVGLLFNKFKAAQKVNMFGGRTKQLIESGKVKLFQDIKCFHENEVEFMDGQKICFDVVVFTTGFKYSNKFSLETKEGFFELGKEGQTNYRSRFLRGIRNDTKDLVKEIYKYLNSNDKK